MPPVVLLAPGCETARRQEAGPGALVPVGGIRSDRGTPLAARRGHHNRELSGPLLVSIDPDEQPVTLFVALQLAALNPHTYGVLADP